ncbi:MAG: hypothetical protein MUE34_10920, partial [Acidimicrobiales bacterium]|nr:hypothetical protein [Acidimicrobiales bacterium]
TQQLQALVDGTWSASATPVLLDCPIGDFGDEIPQDVQDAVAEVAAKLESGELNVYEGPLTDNAGNEVLAAGEIIDRQGAYEVSFALEGVTGA